ncbi:hypothetical protein IG631_17075 [Alternaria alternata]|nr:hypothetical protein IG631_17075 [Alternaria alternata]
MSHIALFFCPTYSHPLSPSSTSSKVLQLTVDFDHHGCLTVTGSLRQALRSHIGRRQTARTRPRRQMCCGQHDWEFPYSLEMIRGTDRELGEEVMVSGIGDEVEVEDEMDNEDEDEDGDVDEDYDEGDDDYGEDDDTEAFTQPVQSARDRETFIQDQSSSLAVDLDLLTGKSSFPSSSA